MDFLLFLVCYGLVASLVSVSVFCGEWPIFQGTFIGRIHFFLTFAGCDYFRRMIDCIFGAKGTTALNTVQYYCCDLPNPTLQFIYLAMVGATYAFFVKSCFIYIPGFYLGEVHRYISLLAVGVGVLLFLLTSFSDPGTVNAKNVSQYVLAYPYDDIIFSEKECKTCKIPKPARSKHCSICDCCVARFDHHCGWMNNCIGETNTRYFMSFLFWHFLLCIYGTVVIALIIAGKLEELRVIHILTVYYGIENSFKSLAPHVAQWLLASFNMQLLIMVFLAIVSLLLAGFFLYHTKLCLTNTTTSETFKWEEFLNNQRRVKEAEASAVALKESLGKLSHDKKPPPSKWRNFFGRSRLEDIEVVKTNMYDKGFVHNVYEIVFPLSTRQSFSSNKEKSR
ncbi:hypothetical protein Leryth_005751 [Lithospermum erythrorhizon]|nr:hypothetical protein Leryth_005751 [Lithospermum erythrorhizon]